MAYDKTVIDFRVQPTENDEGELTGLRIQKQQRVGRMSDTGAVLSYGTTDDVGDEMVVPVNKLAALVSELIDWPLYYATGQAERDKR